MWGLLIAFFAVAEAGAAREHPATKIINLLQKLEQQVKQEGEQEAAEFARFGTWCTELTGKKQTTIHKADEQISVSESSIQALTEDIAALEAELIELDSELTGAEASKSQLQAKRDSHNTEYVQNKGDLEGTIQAVGEAIQSLQTAKPELVAQTAKVQKVLALLDIFEPKSGKVVHEFLQARRTQQDPNQENADKFESRTGRTRNYDFKSGGVIEILKQLEKKFEDDLIELNAQETNSANAHKLSDAAKQDEIDAATRAKTTKTELKGRKGQDLSSAETDLEDAQNERNSAKSVLDTTKSTCRTRSDEFAQRQQNREGERAAMKTAVEVLEKVTGVRTPESKGISFLQIDDPRQQIVNLLRKAGATKQTQSLAKLADKIAALKQTPGSGIFDSIKNMIQKMIFRLKSEQTNEDNHKNWCDNEQQKTSQTLDDKNTRRDEFQADINSLTSEIDSLKTAVSENNSDIADMQNEMETETANRNAEHEENTATVKDAQDAQTAIAQAIAVLKDFYKSTGEVAKEAWEFTQVRQATARRVGGEPDAPEPQLWEEPNYTGTDGGSSVIGLLTTVASDFSMMESRARADETTQQDNYDATFTALKIDTSTKQKDTQMKEARINRLSEKLEGKQNDFAHNQKELEANEQYEKDLEHACVDGDSTYEGRKAARTQEVEALKKAQGILENAFSGTAEEP